MSLDENQNYKKDIYKMEFYLQSELITHKRSTYDLIGVLSDIGGIKSLLITLLGVFAMPISAHSFNVKAARELFMARTSTKGLFLSIRDE